MDFTKTQRLGGKAYMYFFTRRIKLPILLLLAIILVWTQEDRLSEQYRYLTNYALKILLLFWVAFMLFKIVRTYFEYRGYAYRFDEEFFHITRGYVTRQEMGVVYHQIQNVTIRQGMIDRISGVSHLIIAMAGHQDPRQAQVILPALNREVARLIQKELLRQARRHAVGYYGGTMPTAKAAMDAIEMEALPSEESNDEGGDEGEEVEA